MEGENGRREDGNEMGASGLKEGMREARMEKRWGAWERMGEGKRGWKRGNSREWEKEPKRGSANG